MMTPRVASGITVLSEIREFLSAIPEMQIPARRNGILMVAGVPDQVLRKLDYNANASLYIRQLTLGLSESVREGVDGDSLNSLLLTLTAVEGLLGDEPAAEARRLAGQWLEMPRAMRASVSATGRYLNYLVTLWDRAESPLLPAGVPLSTIAVRLSVSEPRQLTEGNKGVRLSGESRSHARSGELSEILAEYSSIRSWVVLGDPGTGKTTMLLHAASEVAKSALVHSDAPFPIIVSLAEFGQLMQSDPGYSLGEHFSALGTASECEHLEQIASESREKGRLLLLLDGLDELEESLRSRLLAGIEAFLGPHPGNRVVISSRRVGYKELQGFVQLGVDPLGPDQQRRLLRAICGDERTKVLLRNIAGRKQLREMAMAPLTLTIMALVGRESRDDLTDLLRRQADLFRFGSRILLEGRHKGYRGVLNPEKAEVVLAALSQKLHEMQTAGIVGEVFPSQSMQDMISEVEEAVLSPWQGPRHFLRDVSHRSNIIYAIDTLETEYKYIHRSFREFFAALNIASLPHDVRRQLVESLVHQVGWSEVLVLLGGLTNDIRDHLELLLSGPPDLALRALREANTIEPDLAVRLLALPHGSNEERRRVFHELRSKLGNDECFVDVIQTYLESLGSQIARFDLALIREQLVKCPGSLAKNVLERSLSYLPPIPERILEHVSLRGSEFRYWCTVPSGSFAYGANRGDSETRAWICELTNINVSEFDIARVPVTNRLYEVFDPDHRHKRAFQEQVSPQELDDHPVVNISWFEADLFCLWLAQLHAGVRLPTEVEWEKAASWSLSGEKRRFPWGNEWDSELLNSWESGPNRTTPVGRYPLGASAFQVEEMAGNVWEWCRDWFDEDVEAYQRSLSTSAKDPQGPPFGTRKIDRGGGWYHDVGVPCTFLRAADLPTDVFAHCGFRLCRGKSG